jgi:CelD/BcsL family acetyltransferase involved in cellulose biosynthesis
LRVAQELTSRPGLSSTLPPPERQAAGGAVLHAMLADRNDMPNIASQWRKLTQTAPNALPFNGFDFLHAWLKTHPDSEPIVILGWDGDTLAAAIPLTLNRSPVLTTIEWMGEPFTEYGDVLARPDVSPEAIANLLQEGTRQAADRAGGIDVVMLRKVRADATIAPALRQLGLTEQNEREAPFVVLPRELDRESLISRFSANMRKELRRKRRKLEAQGNLSFAVHRSGPEAEKAVEKALIFKSEWLACRGLTSRAFSEGRERALIQQVLKSQNKDESPKAGVAVSELALDGRTLASEIGFYQGSRYYAFLGSYDEAMADWGAGTLQMEETMLWCSAQGFECYDLFAPADSYKLRWTTDTVAVKDFSKAYTMSGKAMLAYRQKLRPGLKSAYEQMPPALRKPLSKIAGKF